MKKLFVFDLDGTLLNSKHVVSMKSISTLNYLRKKGHKVIIATGRGKVFIDPAIKNLSFKPTVIGNNGGFIYDYAKNESRIMAKLPLKTSDWMLELAEKENNWIAVHTINSINIISNNREVDGYGKTMIDTGKISLYKNKDEMFKFVKQKDILQISIHEKSGNPSKLFKKLTRNETKHASFCTSTRYYFIANPKNIDKFATILKLAKEMNISNDDIYCFGDSNNDLTMIKGAGVGIAMGNATEQIKKSADVVIDTNDNEGIAKYIEENF